MGQNSSLQWTDDQNKPLKGLLILLLFLLPGLMAPMSVIASPTSAAPRNAGGVASTVPLHAAKSPATLTLTQTTDARGRIRLVASSNAKNVVVVYRSANRVNRRVTARIRAGVARLTLPAGATGILAQTKSTSRLAPSPLIVASPLRLPTPAPRRASPGPVTGISAAAVSQEEIALSWVNPRDRDLQAIVVYGSVATREWSLLFDEVFVLPPTETTLRDLALTPDTVYRYAIATVDRDLNVSAVAQVMATTLPDTTPEAPVSKVFVGEVSRTSVALTWEGPVPPGDVQRVQVRRAIGTRAPATTVEGTLVVDQPRTVSSFTDVGLTAGTQYSYSVFTLDTYGNASTPVSITTTTTSWAMISAGMGRTCALDTRGTAWCWGAGNFPSNALGSSSVPVRVAGGRTFTSLTVGEQHVCALDPVGAAWCWGEDNEGELGDGPEVLSQSQPVAVSGGHVFTTLSSGHMFTCGLDNAGTAWCWGENSSGTLGDGTQTNRFVPVAVSGGHAFTALTAGDDRACAVDTAGTAWCWGLQIALSTNGLGYLVPSPLPVAVPGGLVFTSLATQWGLTCGLDTAGIVWCWGLSPYGALGDGTSTYRPTPVRFPADRTYKSIAASGDRTCALEITGAVWCWGSPPIGDGTHMARLAPTAVVGGHTFANVDVGQRQSCGVDTLGKAWCWGANPGAEIGDGTFLVRPAPVEIAEPIG